jgi:DNA ligase (NAD+)
LKDYGKVRFYCPNFNWCEAQIVEKLAYAVGKDGFNIDWFWDKQVKKFYKLWFIKNLSDIFEIKKFRQEILDLEWFQEKSVNNIINNVEKAKNTDISTLLNSLSIAWVWKKTSKTLSVLFKSQEDLLNFSYSIEDIEKLDDIWPEIAKNIFEFFNNTENKKLLEKLVDLLNIKYFKEKNIENKNNFFYWKKVCITWSFEQNWKKISRDELVKKLEEVWWNFVTSVSKNTDFLLAWEKAGSKLEKAKKLGVEILDLKDFFEKIKQEEN